MTELPLRWWRVEVRLESAVVFTMVRATDEEDAKNVARREQEARGHQPLACSEPVYLGEV